MDNITHSLVGVALADLASSRRAPKLQRPVMIGAGIIAANLPDLDLVYSGITPAPIGYLLHHRGHTHTVIGIGILAVLLALVYRVLPPVPEASGPGARKALGIDRRRPDKPPRVGCAQQLRRPSIPPVRFAVDPATPFLSSNRGSGWCWESRWRGCAQPNRLARRVVAVAHLVADDCIRWESSPSNRWQPWPSRAQSSRFRREKNDASTKGGYRAGGDDAGPRGDVLYRARRGPRRWMRSSRKCKVALSMSSCRPILLLPLCWIVIAVELNEDAGRYRLWRGTLSLAPRWQPPTACASDRLVETNARSRTIGDGALALKDEIQQPLSRVRGLARDDCWVRAWLRFARAPAIQEGELFDLRFANRRNQNFSHMPLAHASHDAKCPGFVPNWGMPKSRSSRRT